MFSDNNIKAWDMDSLTRVGEYIGHSSEVLSLAIWKDRLFSGSETSTIRVWDLNVSKNFRRIFPNFSLVIRTITKFERTQRKSNLFVFC